VSCPRQTEAVGDKPDKQQRRTICSRFS